MGVRSIIKQQDRTATGIQQKNIKRSVTQSKELVRSEGEGKFFNQEEYFDRLPKTDYTYSRTATYSTRFLAELEERTSPNMSRRRLGSVVQNLDAQLESSSYDHTLSKHRSQSRRTSAVPGTLFTSSNVVTRSRSAKGSPITPGSVLSAGSTRLGKGGRYSKTHSDYGENIYTTTQTEYISSTTNASKNDAISSTNSLSHLYDTDSTYSNRVSRTQTETTLSSSSSTASSHSSTSVLVSRLTTLQILISTVTSTAFAATSHASSRLIVNTANIASSIWWYIGVPVYEAVSCVLVWDVWILSRTSAIRRKYGLLIPLLLVFLIPLLMAGLLSWYNLPTTLLSTTKHTATENVVISNKEVPTSSWFVDWFGYSAPGTNEDTVTTNIKEDSALRDKVQQLILNVNQYRADWLSRKEIEQLIQNTVKHEISISTVGVESQRNGDNRRQTEVLKSQQTDLETLKLKLQGTIDKTQDLSARLTETKSSLTKQDGNLRDKEEAILARLNDELTALKADITDLQSSQGLLVTSLKKECCKNDSFYISLIRAQVNDYIGQILAASGSPDTAASPDGIAQYLQQTYSTKGGVDQKLAHITDSIMQQVKEKPVTSDNTVLYSSHIDGDSGISEQTVKMLVQDALNTFSADKTGMVDYAMESAGGSIISTRCSETYHRRTAQLSLFGIPLWYTSNSPRTVIQPDVNPGQCWAFKGSHGYIVIQLSGTIQPTSFSLEHIPKNLSPTGNIDSAPKDFSAWGLNYDTEKEGQYIGNYTYDRNGPPLQFFSVSDVRDNSFPIIELKIHSNHGNPEYTCVYRFRVHGFLKHV